MRMVTHENPLQRRGFAFLFIWYAGLVAVAPQILMAGFWMMASRLEGYDHFQLPITFYCMPVALLFGHNGGGHFYLHAEVFPADFIGWGSVLFFWLAVSAGAAFVHTLCRDRKTSA